MIYLPKGSLIIVNGVELSEHNRSEASIDYEKILSGGDRDISTTLRSREITYKAKLSVSWELLPALDSQTVDGKAGRNTLKTLANTLWLVNADAAEVSYKEVDINNQQIQVTKLMLLESFSDELVKRHSTQRWNVNMEFVEV